MVEDSSRLGAVQAACHSEAVPRKNNGRLLFQIKGLPMPLVTLTALPISIVQKNAHLKKNRSSVNIFYPGTETRVVSVTLKPRMEPEPEHIVPAITLGSYTQLLRGNRNFRRLWLAQIVSEIGDWFYTLSIYTLLLQLTGRASSVALALVLQVLPQTFVGPTAGVVNDRLKRKRVMITADLIRAVIVLSMLLVRSREMVWLVYPLLLLETIMAAFFEPARSSVIPNITSREDVIVANTLGSTTWSMNLVLGATLGGIVAALLGRDAVFVLNALSFLISALFITGMHFAEPHAGVASPLRPGELFDYSPI